MRILFCPLCISLVKDAPGIEVASGHVSLEVHAVRTNDDCLCSVVRGECYPAAYAAWNEALGGPNSTDVSYGTIVRLM